MVPCQNVVLLLQKMTALKLCCGGYDFRKGSQWVSVTNAFCRYLIELKPRLLPVSATRSVPMRFFYKWCCRNPLSASMSIMRRTKTSSESHCGKSTGNGGVPYIWRTCDIDELLNSTTFFACKFSSREMKAEIAIERAVPHIRV